MERYELKEFSPHDKVKDKVGEILAYYRSFLVDLELMQAFYATHDDDQLVCDNNIVKRGDGLATDVVRLSKIYALDEQIRAREATLGEPLELQNTVAHLTSEIVRLSKLREEVAEESIAAIVKGMQEEFTDKLAYAVFNAVRLHTPQLELDARLDKMLAALTKAT